MGDPSALEGGSTDVDLVVGPPAVAGGCTEGDRVGVPPVLVGGSTSAGSRGRRVGGQIASGRARADRRDARLVPVDERIGLVREVGRRPKAADCPAAPIEEGGSQGGVVGAAA